MDRQTDSMEVAAVLGGNNGSNPSAERMAGLEDT